MEWLIALAVVLALLTVLCLVYLLILVRPHVKKSHSRALLCDYAHRGLHGSDVPENSLTAFEFACQSGFGIELDVQLSRDGHVMVFHDYTLARMTGCDKKLCELDAAQLQALSLAGTDQTIPTFEQVLDLVAGRVPILVELKGEDTDTSLCQKVAAHLRAYDGAYCIESFNPLLVREMQKHLPSTLCGLLYTNVCRDKKKRSVLNIALTAMALNFLARPGFIAYNKEDRNSLPVKLTTRLYHAPKFVWTAKSDSEISEAHESGAYAIFER